MQGRIGKYIDSLADKTIGYLVEQFIAVICSVVILISACKWPKYFVFVLDKDFLDKLITIGTTLFGFLITVLTLIIQSNSDTIRAMRTYRSSYTRLILFNKRIVMLAAVLCIWSMGIMIAKIQFPDCPQVLNILGYINLSIFLWATIDSVIFVRIFYTLLITERESS